MSDSKAQKAPTNKAINRFEKGWGNVSMKENSQQATTEHDDYYMEMLFNKHIKNLLAKLKTSKEEQTKNKSWGMKQKLMNRNNNKKASKWFKSSDKQTDKQTDKPVKNGWNNTSITMKYKQQQPINVGKGKQIELQSKIISCSN